MYPKLVLAIPHSVGTFDETAWSDPLVVRRDADRWTDWFTDQMFGSNLSKVSMVVGQICRFECDLERLLDDPLEAEGRGVLYVRSHSGATREIDMETRGRLMAKWYAYRDDLKSASVEGCLLIDCHSFPSDIGDVDICIGFNEDESRPSDETIELIRSHFERNGLSVGINQPYSNSIAPDFDFPYQSLMIELNKRIYLCERTYQLLPNAEHVRGILHKLYLRLLDDTSSDGQSVMSRGAT